MYSPFTKIIYILTFLLSLWRNFWVILWSCRIVWCTLTSWYLVSLLPVSIIHVSVILLVDFWSWEISFIMWGCRGWGWQAAGTWVSVSRPHRVTWSQPINIHPVKSPRESWKARRRLSLNKGPRHLYQQNCFKFEPKPGKFVPIGLLCKHVVPEVCTNRIALQTCNQSLCNPYVIC